MFRTLFSCIFLVCVVATSTLAQSTHAYTSKSKKAIGFYEESTNYYVRRQYGPAITLLEKALHKDKDFAEAHFMLSKIYQTMHRDELAKIHLEQVVRLQPDNPVFVEAHYMLAKQYFAQQQYDKAKQLLQKVSTSSGVSKLIRSEAQQLLINIDYARESIKHPLPYAPHMVEGIANQMPLQYFPVLTVDQQELIFTGRRGVTPQYDEDIYVSRKGTDGQWQKPEPLSDYLSSPLNEGTCTISADGRTLIYTFCDAKGGFGSCDLYISRKTGDQWSPGKNLGPSINTSAWESQPTLSADGRTIYFVSDRKGGMGSRDIYVSSLNDSLVWSQAENVGPAINTSKDEISPFIHVNGQTLYFSSNGRPGFGGYDLYFAERKDQQWSEPKNLGYPINTHEDQAGLFITADGKDAYYSQELVQNGDYLSSQIYTFVIPKEIRVTNRSSYVYGKVLDAVTKEPLKAAIELIDLKAQHKIAEVSSDSIQGDYMMVLTEGSDYALYVNKENYLFQSLSFDDGTDTSEISEPVAIDIYLQPIEKGKETVLNNIFFDTDKYAIKDRSEPELNKIITFMKQNPGIRIAINGHTDNVGQAVYNQTLSANRAKAVYDYLINAGISTDRLAYKGYGQTKPIATNDTEEGRQQNRRITFEVL